MVSLNHKLNCKHKNNQRVTKVLSAHPRASKGREKVTEREAGDFYSELLTYEDFSMESQFVANLFALWVLLKSLKAFFYSLFSNPKIQLSSSSFRRGANLLTLAP